MDQLNHAVKHLGPARDDAALPYRQQRLQIVTARMKEHDLKVLRGIADRDAIGPPAPGWRMMGAHRHLDRHGRRQGRISY